MFYPGDELRIVTLAGKRHFVVAHSLEIVRPLYLSVGHTEAVDSPKAAGENLVTVHQYTDIVAAGASKSAFS